MLLVMYLVLICCYILLAHEAATRRVVSPSIAVEPSRSEGGGAIPRPMKQGTRTKVKREPVGK